MLFHFQIISRQCFSINQCFLKQSIRRISQSYYDILKVSQTCTSKEVRDAFILLSKKNHPDRHLNDPSMHEKFVQINEAYSTLMNPSKRRAYDLTLYNKRKLNAPYERNSSYSETVHRSYGSTRYKSEDYDRPRYNAYEGPFSRNTKTENAYYQPKRYSNRIIVSFLVAVMLLGATLQMLAIRRSFLTNQQNSVERSKEYGKIHTLARERARLYGNARQIEILKNNLNIKDDDPVEEPVNNIVITTQNNTEHKTNDDIFKNGKCKRHENLNNVTAFCPKHQKNNIPDNSGEKTVLNHDKLCKKCNKKINK